MRHDLPLDSIRVCVVDGTRVYAELLADALKRDERLQVTTVPPDSERLSRCPELANCDVLVISSNLGERPGRGIELLRGLRAVYSGLQAVVLLDGSQNETILEAFRAGARGVFSKNDSVATLSKCIRRVYEGQVWADTGQVNTLLGALASIYEIRAVDARGLDLLSKREMEVVRGVAAGLSNQEIAKRLHLSQHTVKNCLFRVFDKLGVSSRVELLLMTLSGDKDARSAATPFFSHRAYENLRDEGTMAACESAARQGVLSAQVMLAKYHDRYNPDPNAAVYAYRWYTVAGEQISRNCRKLAKSITIEQILEAEELAAEDLSDLTDGITASTEVPVVLKAAPETVQEARPAGNLDRVAKSSA